eukprot:CAMPEP_0202450180 /NCGR_PEP_ID=MMETSP1360-20130828/8810_1 /ASSEMBLY_ACC=CAM_ASM_000848 /TAXON_ID=515479 /ORGANISM="Licmophora paradoxa, Strain CCMP2313" /LENGTH=235 /DNA_ID=CAMNT_0049068335 /DNA_START=1 /DNA_END=708 /DNA_ORIENTATION=+
MGQELRRRKNGAFSEGTRVGDDDQLEPAADLGLSAESLLKASPPQYGTTLKLNVPIMFTIAPEFVQRAIVSWSCLSCLAPQWKKRLLIQLGDFLYRYQSDQSKTPKGRPQQVDTVDVFLTDSLEPDLYLVTPDPTYPFIFCVSTLQKKQYYAVSSRQEALMWVNALREARQEAITRSLGHANHVPYPQTWKNFDALGHDLARTKDRIKHQMEKKEFREMEMATGLGQFSKGGVYT